MGAVAILVVIYGSTDRHDQIGLMPALRMIKNGTVDRTLKAKTDEGLRWSVPKSDKLQTTSGAQSTRFIIHDTLKVKKANREYIHAKPYARIIAHLAPVGADYADVIPPFNPFKLYASDNVQDPTRGGEGAANSDVSIKVVELLGGILPGEDGQELDAQEVGDLVMRGRDGTIGAEVAAIGEPAAQPITTRSDNRAAVEPAGYNTTRLNKTTFEADETAADDLENKQIRIVKVGKTEALWKIIQQAGGDVWQAKAMAETAKVFIPDGLLTTGQEVRLTMVPSLTQAGRLEPARFSVFTEGHDHKVTVTRSSAGEFVASATPFEEQMGTTEDGAQGQLASLYSSFYAAALMQNVPAATILQMLRVHAYETDFRRRVRPSDQIEMFFDLKDDTSPESAPSELLFTGLVGSGAGGRFWRFRSPDGVVDFYDEQGNNSKKFLMRKPIRSDDARLTSGFGLRFHPLFNDRRMHTGIDWSAPIGTPIVAAGTGVVEEAHYKGGNGKYVRIRHANGYQTAYSHMSGWARGIEPGAKVRQGQIIGFLGNTGYSTGPHLHFEILVNSRFVDPLSIQVPRDRQLTGRQLLDFQKERARIDELMRRPPVMTQVK